MQTHETLNRLRWQCRRGMLELDVFLQKFLNEAYEHLSEQDQQLFVRLLESSDQDLFIWLTARAAPQDEELAYMVKQVREHALSQRCD